MPFSPFSSLFGPNILLNTLLSNTFGCVALKVSSWNQRAVDVS
jgi:hypothetical protein